MVILFVIMVLAKMVVVGAPEMPAVMLIPPGASLVRPVPMGGGLLLFLVIATILIDFVRTIIGLNFVAVRALAAVTVILRHLSNIIVIITVTVGIIMVLGVTVGVKVAISGALIIIIIEG